MLKSDLTLYRLTTDDPAVTQALFGADDVTVLGRDAANETAEDLICREDVLTVQTEPIAWGSAAELDLIAESYFNGVDLGGALLPLAEAAGLDVEPERFDTVALLDALRGLTREPLAA